MILVFGNAPEFAAILACTESIEYCNIDFIALLTPVRKRRIKKWNVGFCLNSFILRSYPT